MADIEKIFTTSSNLEDLKVVPPRILQNESIFANYFCIVHFHIGVSLETIFEQGWTNIVTKTDEEILYLSQVEERSIRSAMIDLDYAITGNRAYKKYYFGQNALKAILSQTYNQTFWNDDYPYIRRALLGFKEALANQTEEEQEMIHQYHYRWTQYSN